MDLRPLDPGPNSPYEGTGVRKVVHAAGAGVRRDEHLAMLNVDGHAKAIGRFAVTKGNASVHVHPG